MNPPYPDPRNIDFTDGLNPAASPRYREARNSFTARALDNPTMRELRNTPGLIFRLRTVPDDAVNTLQPGASQSAAVTFPPGSWIIGLSASSTQPEGFRTQITMQSGANVFSAPIDSANLKGRPVYLAKPQGLTAPSITVLVLNLSPAANVCQLCIWSIEPPE